jgi:hypothetical protein
MFHISTRTWEFKILQPRHRHGIASFEHAFACSKTAPELGSSRLCSLYTNTTGWARTHGWMMENEQNVHEAAMMQFSEHYYCSSTGGLIVG